jgi:hypothetical protein
MQVGIVGRTGIRFSKLGARITIRGIVLTTRYSLTAVGWLAGRYRGSTECPDVKADGIHMPGIPQEQQDYTSSWSQPGGQHHTGYDPSGPQNGKRSRRRG